MSAAIEAAAKARGISRLCHFTPSRNLQHIAAGRRGVLATSALEKDERSAYNATDLERLDRRKTHICVSIEYPNGWYFDRVRAAERLFPDWVVLLINPKYLWLDDTLFSPRNAAADYGRHIVEGHDGFESLFADSVRGTRNAVFRRTASQSSATPTDQQAEVLVRDQIHLNDIIGVAVATVDQAMTERARLRTNGLDPNLFQFLVAPNMFQKYILSDAIKAGRAQPEQIVVPPHVK